MSLVKLASIEEGPEEGKATLIHLVHPLTEFEYQIAMFRKNDRVFAMADKCLFCESSLSAGEFDGKFVFCVSEEHGWNIKNGICKTDRTRALPTYKVDVREDGFYIEI